MTEQIKHCDRLTVMEYFKRFERFVYPIAYDEPFNEAIKNKTYNQALEDVMKIYNEMQPQLATHVYEFGERLKQLKEQSNDG